MRETDTEFVLDRPLPPVAIPASLHDSLMSRLDRMAPVKEIPQIGAAIGRLHIRIAEALEERFPEAVESEPEQLARHYTEAGLAERAIRYWLKSGQRATERSANVEAIAHLISGLDLLESLPDTAERLQQDLRLQIALSAPLIATKGYGAPETARAFARAEKLCEKLGDVEQWFTVLYGQWAHTIVRAEHQSARQLAEHFVGLIKLRPKTDPAVVGHRMLGVTLFFLGEFIEARLRLQRALAFYDEQRHAALAFYGQDPGVAHSVFSSLAVWQLWYPDQALRTCNDAITRARERDHTNTLAYALCFGGIMLQYCRRDVRGVAAHASALTALSNEHALGMWLAYATMASGWALVRRCRAKAGLEQLRNAPRFFSIAGYLVRFSQQAKPVWCEEPRAGCLKPGETMLDEALALVEGTGERWIEAELLRLKGE